MSAQNEPSSSVLLEVCIDSFASAQAAKLGGADRLEVCSALAVGGTTPSFGLVEQCVAEVQLPVMMMIRPHDGGFVLDDDHLDTMITDIEVAKSLGVQGVVFGALTADRHLDLDATRALMDAADDLEVTFHRAFDLVVDPVHVLGQLEELGVHRILTSGQKRTAMEGASLLRQLVETSKQALKQTSLLAGSGVNAQNAQALVQQTGVREVHASASVSANDAQSLGDSETGVSFGAGRRVTCDAKVRAIVEALASI